VERTRFLYEIKILNLRKKTIKGVAKGMPFEMFGEIIQIDYTVNDLPRMP